MKKLTERVDDIIDKAGRGEFIPDRERDELTHVLENAEHPGCTRGFGNLSWKYGFASDAQSYRSRHRSKAKEDERVRNLENELAQTKASIPTEVARQVAIAMDSFRMQGLLPVVPADMVSPQHPARTRVHGSSCASTELPPPDR